VDTENESEVRENASAEEAVTDVPSGYRLVATHTATRATLWAMQIVSIPLTLVAVGLLTVSRMLGLRIGPIDLVQPEPPVLLLVLGLVIAFPLHELAHGLAIRMLGGRPRYGCMMAGKVLPVLYATSAMPLRRREYLLVALAPTIGLNLVLLVAMALLPRMGILFLTAGALSTAGAVGDWWAVLRLLRIPRGAWVQDHPSDVGFREIAPRGAD
jgi:hypothetical protein